MVMKQILGMEHQSPRITQLFNKLESTVQVAHGGLILHQRIHTPTLSLFCTHERQDCIAKSNQHQIKSIEMSFNLLIEMHRSKSVLVLHTQCSFGLHLPISTMAIFSGERIHPSHAAKSKSNINHKISRRRFALPNAICPRNSLCGFEGLFPSQGTR